jgi:hypothetical protein
MESSLYLREKIKMRDVFYLFRPGIIPPFRSTSCEDQLKILAKIAKG